MCNFPYKLCEIGNFDDVTFNVTFVACVQEILIGAFEGNKIQSIKTF